MQMFVNFEEIFSPKPQASTKVPDSMVEYLNKSLPQNFGMKYEARDNGVCMLVSDGKQTQIGGVTFIPNTEQQKVLGKKYDRQDVIRYFYNMQLPIPLKPEKEGFITINGTEIPIDMLYQHPYVPIKHVDSTFYIMPQPFPAPTRIEVSSAEFKRELLIHRVPNNSLNIAKYESDGDQPLLATFFVNEANHSMSLTLSLKFSFAKSIRDIVESVYIFNAFMDGEGYLQGELFDAKHDRTVQKRFDDESALFWKKVLQIEECLKLSFTPPENDIDYATARKVEQLYQSLILKRPIKENRTLDSISAEWDPETRNDISASKGKGIFLMFHCNSVFDLFGAKFTLPSIVGVCNAIMSDIKVEDKKSTIYFSNENDEHPRYTSIICFKSEDDLQKYENEYKGKHNELMEVLMQAETTDELLI